MVKIDPLLLKMNTNIHNEGKKKYERESEREKMKKMIHKEQLNSDREFINSERSNRDLASYNAAAA